MKKLRNGVKCREMKSSYIIDGRFLEVTSDFGTARAVLGLSNADSLARALVKSMVNEAAVSFSLLSIPTVTSRQIGVEVERFKIRIQRQILIGEEVAATWTWEVTERRGTQLKIVGYGTVEDQANAIVAAADAIAGFLDAANRTESRQAVLRAQWKARKATQPP